MKVFNSPLVLCSREQTEFSDITGLVRDTVSRLSVTTGLAVVDTLHTTCALLINEFQSALIDDLKVLADRLVPERAGYRHDDSRYSNCERGNAHAHLRTALLGRTVTVAVSDGELALGRFQSIIFVEFDGPRRREVSIHVLGE